MKGWLVSFAFLFVLAEIFLWLKDYMLPLPIYLLGGAFLAIASNYDKGMNALFRQDGQSVDVVSQTATIVENVDVLELQSTSESVGNITQSQSPEKTIVQSAKIVKQDPRC